MELWHFSMWCTDCSAATPGKLKRWILKLRQRFHSDRNAANVRQDATKQWVSHPFKHPRKFKQEKGPTNTEEKESRIILFKVKWCISKKKICHSANQGMKLSPLVSVFEILQFGSLECFTLKVKSPVLYSEGKS